MRLAQGIVIDVEKTFGTLKFSALRREARINNGDGTVSNEVEKRTYDLKSSAQGKMIQVSLPASAPIKDFAYNAEVELVNLEMGTVATPTYRGADVEWFAKAEDMILKTNPSPQKQERQERQEKNKNQKEGK
jgi:hypothetical protein